MPNNDLLNHSSKYKINNVLIMNCLKNFLDKPSNISFRFGSPMSHFSSTSGLLSHPGLSSSGQLPHLKQEFPGKDSGAHLKNKCNIFS